MHLNWWDLLTSNGWIQLWHSTTVTPQISPLINYACRSSLILFFLKIDRFRKSQFFSWCKDAPRNLKGNKIKKFMSYRTIIISWIPFHNNGKRQKLHTANGSRSFFVTFFLKNYLFLLTFCYKFFFVFSQILRFSFTRKWRRGL